MNLDDLSDLFAKLEIKIQQQLSRDLPKKVGNLAVRLFKQNFQRESFFGKAWQEVKRRLNPKTKGAASRRRILTGPTGNLGRSIQFTPRDGSVLVFSDLPYSSAHNEGTNNAGRSHSTRIPQRQFMGDDQELEQQVRQLIEKEISNTIK